MGFVITSLLEKIFSSFRQNLNIYLYICTRKHQEQFNLHQPSETAAVVKIRCGRLSLTSKKCHYEQFYFQLLLSAKSFRPI